MIEYTIQLNKPSVFEKRSWNVVVEKILSNNFITKEELFKRISNKEILNSIKDFWYLSRIPTKETKKTKLLCEENTSCSITVERL